MWEQVAKREASPLTCSSLVARPSHRPHVARCTLSAPEVADTIVAPPPVCLFFRVDLENVLRVGWVKIIRCPLEFTLNQRRVAADLTSLVVWEQLIVAIIVLVRHLDGYIFPARIIHRTEFIAYRKRLDW